MAYDPQFIPGVNIALPKLGARTHTAVFNSETPIDHKRFSMVFNQERSFALYTAHNIDGATLIAEGVIDRHDNFRNDPLIDNNLQVDNNREYRTTLGTEVTWLGGDLCTGGCSLHDME